MIIRAKKKEHIKGVATIPRSKPHMQRALVLALLTKGKTIIEFPSWSSETEALLRGVTQLGLKIIKREHKRLVVEGVGKNLQISDKPIYVEGSGTMCRIMIAVALLSGKEIWIEGKQSLIGRPMDEFLEELSKSGLKSEYAHSKDTFRLHLKGTCDIAPVIHVNIEKTSQFMTALLLVAPLFETPVKILSKTFKKVSESYIDLTVEMIRERGAKIYSRYGGYQITPIEEYILQDIVIPTDFTSLSYIIGMVLVSENSSITINDFYPSSMRSERLFFSVAEQLGCLFDYDISNNILKISKKSHFNTNVIIDVQDIPTVVPTLAAVSPFVTGKVQIHNAGHVENHKTKRLSVMIDEMSKMGIAFDKVFNKEGVLDGFITTGPQEPLGGACVNANGDHRNFMSLFIASLKTREDTYVKGADLIDASYPEFLKNIESLAVI